MVPLFITSHAAQFLCSQCARCCKNRWHISIDAATFAKYQTLAESDFYFKSHFHHKTGRNGEPCFDFLWNLSAPQQEPPGALSLDVAQVTGCGFLTGTNSCYVHATYGAGSLSSVCLAYPKVYFHTRRGIECGISYSCPTAANALDTQLSIMQLSDEQRTFPLPGSIRELELSSYYFSVEEEIIGTLQTAKGGVPDTFEELFSRTADPLPPVCAVLSGAFSLQLSRIILETYRVIPVTGDRIAAAVSSLLQKMKNERYETLSHLHALEKEFYPEFEKKYRLYYLNYFINYYFTKGFYPYRHSFADTLVMLLYICTVIKLSLLAVVSTGQPPPSFQEIIGYIETVLVHNNKLCIDILGYLSDWY